MPPAAPPTPRRTRAVILMLAVATLVGVAWSAAATPGRAAADPATPQLQFFDDFNGPAGSLPDPTRWGMLTGGNWNGGTQLQQYTNRAANAQLTGNGSLLITAQGETYTGTDHITRDYTSARLMSKQSVLYGTVSARIRMSGSPGAWPAFWAFGANYAQVGWPACGELDVMEALNNAPNLYGSVHGPWSPARPGQAYNAGRMISPTGGLGTGWHVYAAYWTPTSITFSLDGVPYVTVLKSSLPAGQTWAMDNPENLVLNIAVGGMAGTPAPPADFHASMEVDWVSVTSAGVDESTSLADPASTSSDSPSASAPASAPASTPVSGTSSSTAVPVQSPTSSVPTSSPSPVNPVAAPSPGAGAPVSTRPAPSGPTSGRSGPSAPLPPVTVRRQGSTRVLMVRVSPTVRARARVIVFAQHRVVLVRTATVSGPSTIRLRLPRALHGRLLARVAVSSPGGTSRFAGSVSV